MFLLVKKPREIIHRKQEFIMCNNVKVSTEQGLNDETKMKEAFFFQRDS